MAKFEGTIQEFHHFIGPRIRNIINTFAKKERLSRNGTCEDCQETGKTLESAHVHGRGRRVIIEKVLQNKTNGNIVCCELKEIEKEILDEHGTIADVFKFLCKECHAAYDNLERGGLHFFEPIINQDRTVLRPNKLSIIFVPEDEVAFKNLLVEKGEAFVRLRKLDGSVEPIARWNATRFRNTSNLRGNLFSGYLRNWKQREIVEAVFAIDRASLV